MIMESVMTAANKQDMLINDGIAFPGLDEVEERLKDIITEAEGITGDMCVKLLRSGGKRLRPKMVIMSGLCFTHLSTDIIDSAVAAELIHMASLVHDDVIDKSDSRRGYSTLNSLYGSHPAVLAGDYLFAKAFHLMSSKKLLKSMEYLADAISQMCDGEISQMNDFFNVEVTVDDYFKRIGKKTAILISSCCRAGAATAGAGDDYIKTMYEYGMNIGYAFQIVDDILDFIGDSSITGKPAGEDLLSGNITLPVILLLNDSKHGQRIKKLIKESNISYDAYIHIKELLINTGVVDKSYEMAQNCVDYAKKSIIKIPDSPYRTCFTDIADKILIRKY